jgi:centromeric protein E
LNQNESKCKRVWKVLPQDSAVAEITPTGQSLVKYVSGRNLFHCDQTFGEAATTSDVYNGVCKDIVSSAVAGLNGTIFTYGQTSSGKTHTMSGSGTNQDGSVRDISTTDGTTTHSGGGVVHMAAADIFSHVESQPDRIFLVRVSFLEVYNEEIRDLLTESDEALKIREAPQRGFFVQSKEEIVTDSESLLSVLISGEQSRTFASTSMNERSSRSHTIFSITIESRSKPQEGDEENNDSSSGDGAVLVATLNFVDLAGSEGVRHTGAMGKQQKEGGMINQR